MSDRGLLTALDLDPIDLAAHELVDSYPGKAKALGALAHIPPGTLANKSNPNQPGQLNVRELVTVTALARNFVLMDAIEQALGRVGVEVGDYSGTSDLELLDLWAHWLAEQGRTAARIREALSDGVIDEQEFVDIRREVFRDLGAELALLARLEAIRA